MRYEPTTLIMSGVESDSYWGIAKGAGITRLLVSYLYIQRKGKRFLQDRLKENPEIKMMIDSGAFTFITREEEYSRKTIEYWENYLEKYTAFVRENKEYISSCAELDIGVLVGLEQVEKWRDKYFRPLEEEGILVCYVWHAEDGGMPYWKDMCKRFKYVGVSAEANSLNVPMLIKMLNIAKLNKTIVHGFAITDLSWLLQLPFYSVDSTTWLVGTKFGELNWFDGRKMKRLKKAEWKRTYKTKFIKLGANWELAEKENPYELIRINLLVYRQVEEFVRKRIKAKMYWLKWGDNMSLKKVFGRRTPEEAEIKQEPRKLRKLVKKGVPDREDLGTKTKFEEFSEVHNTKEKSLNDIDFPSKEWFDGDCEDYEHYAKECNISAVSMDKEEVLNNLWSMCSFIHNWEDVLDEIELESMQENCKFYLNKTPETWEECITILKGFYIDNALGKREDFKGESDIDIPERPKEREDYYEVGEMEIVDVELEELSGLLPPPSDNNDMPEVDYYDEELGKLGIVPIRDHKGRFIKGQRAVRKPKNIYAEVFPKLACDTCYKAGECPEYQAGFVCKFHKVFNMFDTRNYYDVIDAMKSMVNMNLGRLQRAAMFEMMDGGMVDPTVSGLIDQNMRLLQTMKDLMTVKPSIIAQQKTTMNADGTMMQETSIHENPRTGGVLEKLLSGMLVKDDKDDEDSGEIIDVNAEEIE